eukprot:363074-Chlamydomonas_euryale.AAC.11
MPIVIDQQPSIDNELVSRAAYHKCVHQEKVSTAPPPLQHKQRQLQQQKSRQQPVHANKCHRGGCYQKRQDESGTEKPDFSIPARDPVPKDFAENTS